MLCNNLDISRALCSCTPGVWLAGRRLLSGVLIGCFPRPSAGCLSSLAPAPHMASGGYGTLATVNHPQPRQQHNPHWAKGVREIRIQRVILTVTYCVGWYWHDFKCFLKHIITAHPTIVEFSLVTIEILKLCISGPTFQLYLLNALHYFG